MHALRAWALGLLVAAFCMSAPAQALRPEVGKPLQQAGELLKAGKSKEALAKVREADAAPSKTAAEQLTIERMRGAAAQRAGDNATAVKASRRFMPAASLRRRAGPTGRIDCLGLRAVARLCQGQRVGRTRRSRPAATARSCNRCRAICRASGDYNAIARDAAAAVAAAEQAGQRPAEGELLRLADAQQRTRNTGLHRGPGKAAVQHPKKDYWAAYLARLPRKSGFSRPLSRWTCCGCGWPAAR